MLTKIVHRTRDYVGIIGVQHIDGPLQVKHWGVRTPATPAALTPMPIVLFKISQRAHLTINTFIGTRLYVITI